MAEIGEGMLSCKNVLRMNTESGSEEVHYPAFYEDLPEEYKLLAEQDLGETADSKEKGIRRLKEFMKKENLSCTDEMLIVVLRSCKYNLKKAESKLKRFLRSRTNIIEKLCRVDDKKIDLILEDTMFTILPYRDKHGRIIFLTKPSVQFDKYSMGDIEPVAMSLILYILNFPLTTVGGLCYLAEVKCESPLIYYTIVKGFKPFVYYAIDLPLRFGRTDVVNENFIVRLFYNIIYPILPEKLSKRIFFHGNSYEKLHIAFHPDILPKDLDGNLEPINNRFYKERLIEFIKTLKEEGRQNGLSVT